MVKNTYRKTRVEKREARIILSPGFAANEADTNCLPAQQSLIRSIQTAYPDTCLIIISFEYPYSQQPYEWFGIRVIPFGGNNKGGYRRLIRWVRIWKYLSGLEKEYQIGGILSFWLGQAALIGHYFSRYKKIPHATWVLGQDARSGNRYLRWMRPKENELIAISDSVAANLANNYRMQPAHIVPNGIDPHIFPESPVHRDIDIIGVGSLIPLKQFDQLVDVIKKIFPVFPGLRVMLCGEGPEKQNISNKINEAGLRDVISLCGEVPHEALLGLLQRAKLMLHPSSYEGFSGACLEALYAGAHVVTYQQPMNGWIRHWHRVANIDEMATHTQTLLSSDIDYTPSLPYRMQDSAKQIMQLLGC